jgi:transposase InsO family protein
MALKRRVPSVGLLHHSAQGAARERDYQHVLAAPGITCSMSPRDNRYDHAVIEAFCSTA